MKQAILAQSPVTHASGSPGSTWAEAIRQNDFETAWRQTDRDLAGRDPVGRDDPALPYHLRWVWDGRPFAGGDVLVRCYHGLGDTIQFSRYLAPLRAAARSLTLEAQPELLPLLTQLTGPDRLIPFRPEAPAAPAACDLEIMELAHALRLRPDAAPYRWRRPVHDWIDTPAGLPPGPRVGLCWQTGGWHAERSIPLPALAPLARVPRVTFFSLQRGPAARELSTSGPVTIANPNDDSTAILDTAGLMLALDLVVTVDTMVAHLAGALGVPVWLLLLAEPDWRWTTGGRSSPWYPRLRKYRQPAPGDWAGAVADLTADLTQAVAADSLTGTRRSSRGL